MMQIARIDKHVHKQCLPNQGKALQNKDKNKDIKIISAHRKSETSLNMMHAVTNLQLTHIELHLRVWNGVFLH